MKDLLAVPLVSKNGVRGKVLTASRLLDDSKEKSVIFENGLETSVASKHLHLRADGSYFLDLIVETKAAEPQAVGAMTSAAGATSPPLPDSAGEVVIPVIHEQARVTKRTVETGRVRVRKTVHEEMETVDVVTVSEEYEVQHVPVNRVVEATEPARVENGTTIIPIYEEQIVTSVRLVLREEIHLIKKQTVTHSPRKVTLRKERVEVERLPARA